VDEVRRENGELAEKLDCMFTRLREVVQPEGEELQPGECEATAAVALREAIAELAQPETGAHDFHEATESRVAQPETLVEPMAEGGGAGPDEIAASWSVDGPVWMGGVEGSPGSTTGELSFCAGYITWNPSSGASDVAWQHIHLSEVLYAEIDDFDDAYQTEEDQVLSGQEIPKGYWLVPVQWYKLVQTSQRAYVVLEEQIQLNVNSMVRLPESIEFEKAKERKQPAQAPAAAPMRVQPGRAAAQPAVPPRPKPIGEKSKLLGRAKAQ